MRSLKLGYISLAVAFLCGCVDEGGGGDGSGDNGSESDDGACESARGADFTYTNAVTLAGSSDGCPELDIRDLNDDDDDDDLITTCNPDMRSQGSVCVVTAECVITASDGSAATASIAFNVRTDHTFNAHQVIKLEGLECAYAVEGTWR